MLFSEIENINDLYKEDEEYDNPYTAICDVCLEEKLLIKEYWYQVNLEYIKEKRIGRFYCKACTKFHGKKHSRARLRKLKKATPKWANLDKIKEIYINCPNGYEVDHVIPLNGSVVSGLHIENNLQYLSVKDNRMKSNSFTM